jgi:hypothetical protein
VAFLYIHQDGSYFYSFSQNPIPDFTGYKIAVPWTKGLFLFCYDNGCVDKVPIEKLFEKKPGRQYSNGLYEGAKLVNILVTEQESYLLILVKYLRKYRAKVFATSNISQHSNFGNKGNQMIGSGFEKVIGYSVFEGDLLERLDYYHMESRPAKGNYVLKKDIAQFKEIFGDRLPVKIS